MIFAVFDALQPILIILFAEVLLNSQTTLHVFTSLANASVLPRKTRKHESRVFDSDAVLLQVAVWFLQHSQLVARNHAAM